MYSFVTSSLFNKHNLYLVTPVPAKNVLFLQVHHRSQVCSIHSSFFLLFPQSSSHPAEKCSCIAVYCTVVQQSTIQFYNSILHSCTAVYCIVVQQCTAQLYGIVMLICTAVYCTVVHQCNTQLYTSVQYSYTAVYCTVIRQCSAQWYRCV